MKTIRRRLFIFLTLLLTTTFSACDESARPDPSSLRDLSPPSDVGVSVPDLSMPDLAPTCHLNGIKDGDETDIDCGGALCLPCARGKSCVVGGDCQGSCVLGICAACRFGLPGPPLLPLNGMDASYLAIGDLNGDGNADIAAAAAGGLTVSVLLGTGGGAFAPKVDYSIGRYVGGVVIADVNGDQKADLVVTNGGNVSVFLNRGAGALAPKVDHVIEPGAGELVVADASGDGRPDFVLVGDHKVIVVPSLGAGVFGAPVDSVVGAQPATLAVGDLDGDGKPDLAVGLYGTPGVVVLINRGGGAFVPSATYGTDPAYSIAIGDINGDGAADLAVDTGNANSVDILLNSGKGGKGIFAAPVAVTVAKQGMPAALALADMNGDGRNDLVVGNGRGATVSVFVNPGGGAFNARTDYDAGPQGVMAIGDLNGDGKLDVAVSGSRSHGLAVLFNDGGGALGGAVSYDAGDANDAVDGIGPSNVQIAIGDLDGDGLADVATTGQKAANVSVFLNRGRGTLAPKVDYPAPAGLSGIAIADMNGDGISDIIVANSSAHAVSILLGRREGGYAAPVDYNSGPGPGALLVTDISGDGKPDVLVTNSGVTVSVLLGTGGVDGALAPVASYLTNKTPGTLAVADLNGDGQPDVVVRSSDGLVVRVFLNLGQGQLDNGVDYPAGQGASSIALADLDGDGKIDIAFHTARRLEVLFNAGNGQFEDPIAVADLDNAYGTIVAADWDGDGKVDLAVNDVGTMFLNRGARAFAPALYFPTPASDVTIAGDLDGDHKADVLALTTTPDESAQLLHVMLNRCW